MRPILFAALSVFLLVNVQSVAARGAPESFAPLVEKLMPAVVNISTTQKVKVNNSPLQFQFRGLPEGQQFDPFREFFERFGQQQNGQQKEREVQSLGSGFVIDASGYIVTNNHVIEQADQINVIFPDDTQLEAEVIGRDPKTDLALLKVEPKKPLPSLKFGDSDDMRVGDWVIAIGNPFGLGGSVSAGIISARSRNINAGPFDDFLQTDAAINRGNSGGPLFNIDGEVVGVNSAIFSPTGGNVGIGFAIPSALAEPVLDQLQEYGRTHRGWLGVKIQPVTDEIAESLGLKKTAGALVLEVNESSPAAKAGVLPGDVILAFNGKRIQEMRELPRLVAEAKVGSSSKLTVWREGRERNLSVELGELEAYEAANNGEAEKSDKATEAKSAAEKVAGLEVTNLTSALRQQLKIDENVKGIIVRSIDPESDVLGRNIRQNDLITHVNQQPVESVKDFKALMQAQRKAGRDYALIRIRRTGGMAFVTIPTKE